MASSSKIDSQGRILIPAEIRRKMKLEPDNEVEIKVSGSDLVIRKKQSTLEADVKEWMQYLLTTSIPAGVVTDMVEMEEKWVDEDYVRKKLGLD